MPAALPVLPPHAGRLRARCHSAPVCPHPASKAAWLLQPRAASPHSALHRRRACSLAGSSKAGQASEGKAGAGHRPLRAVERGSHPTADTRRDALLRARIVAPGPIPPRPALDWRPAPAPPAPAPGKVGGDWSRPLRRESRSRPGHGLLMACVTLTRALQTLRAQDQAGHSPGLCCLTHRMGSSPCYPAGPRA